MSFREYIEKGDVVVTYKKVMWFSPREEQARGRGEEVVQLAGTFKCSVMRENH